MDWAKRTSELSYAQRLKVGAVIVKDDCVISYGYNGMPAGWNNNCEETEYVSKSECYSTKEWMIENQFIETDNGWTRLKTKPEVLHAESNALAKLAKSHNSGLGAELFVTHSPCLECAKLIYQSGISKVYYNEEYRSNAGIEFLKRSGVEVAKHNI